MNYCPLCATPLETRLMENVPRLACSAEDCAYVHWDNPVPVVAPATHDTAAAVGEVGVQGVQGVAL